MTRGDIAAAIDRCLDDVLVPGTNREAELWPLIYNYAAASGSPTDAALTEDGLPSRVIVDQHGHYWRDYGDSLSMCPVSTENNKTEVAATYVRSWPETERGRAIIESGDTPMTDEGRDLLSHVVQYDPEDASAAVVAAKIVAVERAAAGSPEPVLDPERLARAMGSTGNCGHSSCPRDTSRHDDEAREVAREYAAPPMRPPAALVPEGDQG